MLSLDFLTAWVRAAAGRARRDRDRGDVPGWVMVTVMTAILVVAILGVFKSQITSAVTDALNSVTGSAGK
jgi:type VI protein secretion system component VasF